MNEYTLVYENGRTEQIRIEQTLSVGDVITFGEDITKNSLQVGEIDHKLIPQSFDRSITHDTETLVVLVRPDREIIKP